MFRSFSGEKTLTQSPYLGWFPIGGLVWSLGCETKPPETRMLTSSTGSRFWWHPNSYPRCSMKSPRFWKEHVSLEKPPTCNTNCMLALEIRCNPAQVVPEEEVSGFFGGKASTDGQVPSWWLNPTHLKNMIVKLNHETPSFGGENSKNVWVATTQSFFPLTKQGRFCCVSLCFLNQGRIWDHRLPS